MKPWIQDAENPKSTSLAAVHARNAEFGDENCYRCHEKYQIFGTIATKAAGMRHVWLYYTEYKDKSLAESLKEVKLLKPFPNASCMHCHSTETPLWNEVPAHKSAAALVRSGEVSCASGGCHGPAHPFSPVSRATAERLRVKTPQATESPESLP